MHNPCQNVQHGSEAVVMREVMERYTRNETTAERADRRWGELMQELRVTQTGVQVLVGFLFSIAFSNRFTQLSSDQRVLYIVTLVLGASATAVLIAPVSLHRMLFGQRMKPELVRATNLLTLLGLGLLMCTISAAMLLVFEFVLHGSVIAWLAAAVSGWFAAMWYVVPLWLRLRRNAEWEEEAREEPDERAGSTRTEGQRPRNGRSLA
jgi:Na+/melibiose symporter-like transporter